MDTHNQNQNQAEKHNDQLEKVTTLKGALSSKDRMKIYVLSKIHNKKFRVGSRLFYNDVSSNIGGSRSTYLYVLEFLDGANLVVNEVVIADKVPMPLIERYGLKSVEEQSNH